MSTLWEIPVAESVAEPVDGLSRRMLRTPPPDRMPRDARPTRGRRERLPEALRVWGASSRMRTADA
jgi:hypothetical protein